MPGSISDIKPYSVEYITEKYIVDLCHLVLIPGDDLNFDNNSENREYVKRYIDDGISLSGDKKNIRFVVQKEVTDYIGACPTLSHLFSFKSDHGFFRYRQQFYNFYNQYYTEKYPGDSQFAFPSEFDYIFDYIQEAIDVFSIIEKTSIALSEEATARAIENSKKESNAAELSAKTAAALASTAADNAAEAAIEAVIKNKNIDKHIEDTVKNSVDKQINRVTSKISETSVTILAIFSGIVLSIVAGLFYSSSVINNLTSAIDSGEFYKLIIIASLVGLISYNLVILLYFFVEKIKERKNSSISFLIITFFVNLLLVGVFIVGVCYDHRYTDNTQTNDSSVVSEMQEGSDLSSENTIYVDETLNSSSLIDLFLGDSSIESVETKKINLSTVR